MSATVKLEDVVCLDVEGSGIMGYPIEVGLAALDGTVWSTLIRPDTDWLADDTLWSSVSETVHGISQVQLSAGLSVDAVATALNDRLTGKLVLSDSPGIDANWLATLHHAAGIPATYQLRHFEHAEEALDLDYWVLDWSQLKAGIRNQHGLRRHRAGPDALTLARLLAGIVDGSII